MSLKMAVILSGLSRSSSTSTNLLDAAISTTENTLSMVLLVNAMKPW